MVRPSRNAIAVSSLRAVLALRHESRARTAAEPELVAHAGRLSGGTEEIALAAEDDRHRGRAVAQTEEVVQRPHRLAGPAERAERTVAAGVVPADHLAGVDPAAPGLATL